MIYERWYKEQEANGQTGIAAEEEENYEEVSAIFESEAHLIDKNVIRKKILDQIGQKLNKFEGEKDNLYFLNKFYDPLSDDM